MTKAELLKALEPAADDAEIVVQIKGLFSRREIFSEVAEMLQLAVHFDDVQEMDTIEDEPVGYALKSVSTCGGVDEKPHCHIEFFIGQDVSEILG